MKWRVMLELVGSDGIVGVHEVGGRAAVAEYAPRLIGLTLEEGKHLLAALQVRLVQAQAEDHSRRRRRCQRCGAQRPLKDQRSRRLVSLFGTVEVRAPRFTPCRCAVTCRRTLNPVSEIMPDRCTPEYERTVAKMGSLLPYRRMRPLVIDELGYLTLKPEQANAFFRLMDQRYSRVSTIITTNLDLPDWYDLLDKKSLVDALLDRLQHHCITIRIDGPSLRSPEPPATSSANPPRRATKANPPVTGAS